MNILSATFRIVCGFALIILSAFTYHRAAGHIAAGEPIQIFGATVGASSGQLTLACVVIGLIGAFLIIFGVVTLVKKR